MSQTTSSARQLVSILREAKKITSQISSISVLTDILKTSHEKPIHSSGKLSSLCELFNNVRQDARGLGNNQSEKYIRALDVLQECLFSAVIPNPLWNDVKGFIDDRDLDLLEACGENLEAKSKGFIEISPEELDDFKIKIRELIDQIIKCDLEKDVKEKLIFELRKIEDAILSYSIRGACGVVILSEQSTGGIFTLFRIPSVQSSELLKKILNFTLSIPSKYRDAETLNRLIQNVVPVLEGINAVTNLLPPS